jgi:hypothetical protein
VVLFFNWQTRLPPPGRGGCSGQAGVPTRPAGYTGDGLTGRLWKTTSCASLSHSLTRSNCITRRWCGAPTRASSSRTRRRSCARTPLGLGMCFVAVRLGTCWCCRRAVGWPVYPPLAGSRTEGLERVRVMDSLVLLCSQRRNTSLVWRCELISPPNPTRYDSQPTSPILVRCCCCVSLRFAQRVSCHLLVLHGARSHLVSDSAAQRLC